MDSPAASACPTAEMLADFAAGRLGDDDLAHVAEHLEQCGTCLAAVQTPAPQDDAFLDNLQHIHQEGVTAFTSILAPTTQSVIDSGPYFFSVANDPPTHSADAFFDALARSGLFDAEDLDSAAQEWRAFRSADVAEYAQTLVVEHRLTDFQCRQLLRGKTRGWILDDYVVMHPLGAGGIGWVFRAWHRRRERTVALKITPPHLAPSGSALRRLRREIEAISKLRHPRLVPAIDAGESDGIGFLVMEELPGHSLAEWIELNGPMLILSAVDMIRQAAEGVAVAHDAGIIHRDIKPSSIWVEVFTTSGRPTPSGPGVKVIDFGLAHVGDSESGRRPLTGGKTTFGTIGYMAPEQIGDSRGADERSDIYSLGCTLFFLLSGKAPFEGTSPAEVAAKQNQPPMLASPRETVPEPLQRIFARMIAKSPRDRYASVDDLIDDLDAFLAGARLTARRPRWIGRAILGTMGVAVAALIFWAFLPRGDAVTDPDLVVHPSGPMPHPFDGPGSTEDAVAAQKEWATALGLPVELTNSLGMSWRLIPPGTMTLGTPAGEIDDRLAQLIPASDAWQWLRKNGVHEWPARSVAERQPFYLGATEVTVEQFRAFVDATGYRTQAEIDGLGGVTYVKGKTRRRHPDLTWRTPGYSAADRDPVVQVSWSDAEAFCKWLSQRDRRVYALPTETQWEFACRAGSSARWSWGRDPDSVRDNVSLPDDNHDGPRAVALKKPNAFGLFDMAGNVAEWTADRFDADTQKRTVRGGSFREPIPDGVASATRLAAPDPGQDFVGFRVAAEIAIDKRPSK